MTTNVPAVVGSGAVAAYNPFLDAADDMGASSGSLYLKFDGNTGIYSFGKDNEELDKGTRLAVNPNEFKFGWICWKDGEVVDEVMRRVVEGKPPTKDELADHGPYDDEKDGWREQVSVQLRDVEDGNEYLFKSSSAGGRIAIANLVRDYGKNFAKYPGSLAIVELQNTAFDAKDKKTGKKLGRKFAPNFRIVAWENEEELIARLDAASSEAEAEVEEDVEVNAPAETKGRTRRNI